MSTIEHDESGWVSYVPGRNWFLIHGHVSPGHGKAAVIKLQAAERPCFEGDHGSAHILLGKRCCCGAQL